MEIKNVTSLSFRRYGKIIEGYDLAELDERMEQTECPEQGVKYLPSVPELESIKIFKQLSDETYGSMPIQIGFCNGNNHTLNALEYHRDSELNYACTDMILLLGHEQDVSADYSYDTSKLEAFLVKKGTLIEVYATTLHYTPISMTPDGKFRCGVVLPKGTNERLPERSKACTSEDRLITAVNKWLIAHPDSPQAKIRGAFPGLFGENIVI